jgi:hypothetical protein
MFGIWAITLGSFLMIRRISLERLTCPVCYTRWLWAICDSMLLWNNYFSILSTGARADVLIWLRSWLIDTCILSLLRLPFFLRLSLVLVLSSESNKRVRARSIRLRNIMLSDLQCSLFLSFFLLLSLSTTITTYLEDIMTKY